VTVTVNLPTKSVKINSPNHELRPEGPRNGKLMVAMKLDARSTSATADKTIRSAVLFRFLSSIKA